jgi:hypothetical protein
MINGQPNNGCHHFAELIAARFPMIGTILSVILSQNYRKTHSKENDDYFKGWNY